MIRPLDKYLSSKPNGNYDSISSQMKKHKCSITKIDDINNMIQIKKVERDSLIEELITLIKKNSSKHNQFLKETEIKATESYLSDCLIIKRKILLNSLEILNSK